MIAMSISQFLSSRCEKHHIDVRVTQLRTRQPGVGDHDPVPLAVWSELPIWDGGTRCPIMEIPALAMCAGAAAVAQVRTWAVDCAERALARWGQMDSDHQLRRAVDLARAHLRDGTEVSSDVSWELLDLSRARFDSLFGTCVDAVRHAVLCATCPVFLVPVHAAYAASSGQAAAKSDTVEESWQRARLLELLS